MTSIGQFGSQQGPQQHSQYGAQFGPQQHGSPFGKSGGYSTVPPFGGSQVSGGWSQPSPFESGARGVSGGGRTFTFPESQTRTRNQRRIVYEVEAFVLENRKLAYQLRSTIVETAMGITKLQFAAFVGNRQLANLNTEEIYLNRLALARNIPARTDVQFAFKEATVNRVKLEFLDHRSKLNEQVLVVSEELARINSELARVNAAINESNDNIVAFNSAVIEDNKRLVERGGLDASSATPEAIQAISSTNFEKAREIWSRAQSNRERLTKLIEATQQQQSVVPELKASVYQVRQRIGENAQRIVNNRQRIADYIASPKM